MAEQRLVAELQNIIDNHDTVGALRVVVGELKKVFDRHDGIHPSPYTNHVTALALALEEVHQP